jgi:hypothetical protein
LFAEYVMPLLRRINEPSPTTPMREQAARPSVVG